MVGPWCVLRGRLGRNAFLLALSASTMALASLLVTTAAFPVTAPNACAVCRAAHPQLRYGNGAHRVAGAYTSTPAPGASGCPVQVGAVTVNLILATTALGLNGGGFTTELETSPKSLGARSRVILGATIGGSPLELAFSHRAGVWADLEAFGSATKRMTTFARQIDVRL